MAAGGPVSWWGKNRDKNFAAGASRDPDRAPIKANFKITMDDSLMMMMMMYFGDDFHPIFYALEENEAFDEQLTTLVNDVSIDI